MKYLKSNAIFTTKDTLCLDWPQLSFYELEEIREYKGAQTARSPPPALQLTVRELQTVGFIFANDANKHSPPHCVKCKQWSLQCVSYSVDG